MSKTRAKSVSNIADKSGSINKTTVKVKVKKGKTAQNKVLTYKDKQTRIQILEIISEKTRLNKRQVEKVFDELRRIMEGHLKKRGSGEFIVPKIGIKIKRIKKKATKQRKMFSPLIGQNVTINAKPARFSVKVTALKLLQELVS